MANSKLEFLTNILFKFSDLNAFYKKMYCGF